MQVILATEVKAACHLDRVLHPTDGFLVEESVQTLELNLLERAKHRNHLAVYSETCIHGPGFSLARGDQIKIQALL